jgi:hypothetical protein
MSVLLGICFGALIGAAITARCEPCRTRISTWLSGKGIG